MKKSNKALLFLLTALLVLSMGLVAQAKPAAPKIAKTNKLYVYHLFDEDYRKVFKYYKTPGALGYKVKNVDPSVDVEQVAITCSSSRARAHLNRTDDGSVYLYTSCKFNDEGYPITTLPSRYTVSFKITQHNKTYKLKTKIVVKPYPAPIRSLKICGKNVTSSVKQSKIPTIKAAGKKFKASVKLKRGFTLNRFTVMHAHPDEDGYYGFESELDDYILQKGDIVNLSYYTVVYCEGDDEGEVEYSDAFVFVK